MKFLQFHEIFSIPRDSRSLALSALARCLHNAAHNRQFRRCEPGTLMNALEQAAKNPLTLTHDELLAARDWLKDCVWGDLQDEDFDDLWDWEIERGVKRHYVGGVAQFKLDGNYETQATY